MIVHLEYFNRFYEDYINLLTTLLASGHWRPKIRYVSKIKHVIWRLAYVCTWSTI